MLHLTIILSQPLQLFWRDIEIHVLYPDLIFCFLGAGDLTELSGSEMERLKDNPVCGLFGDDEILVVLLDVFCHTLGCIESEEDLPSWPADSVEDQLYLFDIFPGRINLLVDVLLCPLFGEVMTEGHVLLNRVDGIAVVSHD